VILLMSPRLEIRGILAQAQHERIDLPLVPPENHGKDQRYP
jgi:hypothetical protein